MPAGEKIAARAGFKQLEILQRIDLLFVRGDNDRAGLSIDKTGHGPDIAFQFSGFRSSESNSSAQYSEYPSIGASGLSGSVGGGVVPSSSLPQAVGRSHNEASAAVVISSFFMCSSVFGF